MFIIRGLAILFVYQWHEWYGKMYYNLQAKKTMLLKHYLLSYMFWEAMRIISSQVLSWLKVTRQTRIKQVWKDCPLSVCTWLSLNLFQPPNHWTMKSLEAVGQSSTITYFLYLHCCHTHNSINTGYGCVCPQGKLTQI